MNNNKRKTDRKMDKMLKRHFTGERKMARKHKKKCSTISNQRNSDENYSHIFFTCQMGENSKS